MRKTFDWGCRFEKGSTCKQQFKTVDLYQAKPVSTGWFPVSTVAHFTSISNYLESVPPRFSSRSYFNRVAQRQNFPLTGRGKVTIHVESDMFSLQLYSESEHMSKREKWTAGRQEDIADVRRHLHVVYRLTEVPTAI